MFLNKNFDRPASRDAAPVQDTVPARLWYIVSHHAGQLLLANLLCVICSLPMITAPAALSALFAVVIQYYRTGYGYGTIELFFREFRANFIKKLIITCILIGIPAGCWYLGTTAALWFSYVITSLTAAFCISTLFWFFPQTALLQLSVGNAVRNALLLTCLEATRNLLILLTVFAFSFLLLFTWPAGILLFLLVIPAVPVVLITAITLPAIEKRLVHKQ